MRRVADSLLLLGMVAAMGMDEISNPSRSKSISINAGDNTKEHHPKGTRKFIIDGKEVWASNEKNARRKANKK